MQQEQFVNNLVDKKAQATGFQLMFNRFLILFLKCLYIRKKKKITTLFELILPGVIFFWVLHNFPIPIDKKNANLKGGFNLPTTDFKLKNPQLSFKLNLYYDFNSTLIVGDDLKSFLNNAFSNTNKRSVYRLFFQINFDLIFNF